MVAALVGMHLISKLDVSELLRSKNRSYQIDRESPDGTQQLALFATEMGEVHLRNEKPMSCLWAIQNKNYRL